MREKIASAKTKAKERNEEKGSLNFLSRNYKKSEKRN